MRGLAREDKTPPDGFMAPRYKDCTIIVIVILHEPYAMQNGPLIFSRSNV